MFGNPAVHIESSKLEVEDPPFFWRTQSAKSASTRSSLLSAFSFQLSAAGPDAPGASGAGSISSGQPYSFPLGIVIAGGGTGGHLFPGIAVAQEFMARTSETRIIFVGIGNPLEKSVLSKTNYELRTIKAAGIKGRGIWNQVKSVMQIPAGTWGAIRILKNFSPDLIIGLGGYSAGPAVIGAWLLRIPIAIHEQNILPGRANQFLSNFVDRVAISFSDTRQFLKNKRKILLTYFPHRNSLVQVVKSEAAKFFGFNSSFFTLLICGGSQGSESINKTMMDAFRKDIKMQNIQIIHLAGHKDASSVEDFYKQLNINAKVFAFLNEINYAYCAADFVISRCGASTIMEIMRFGLPSILIP